MEEDLIETERRAPIWQPSGDGYDLVPYVHYDSYDEYFEMLRQLKRSFYVMVSEFVENALGNSVMNPRSISHHGLLGIWRDMRCKGLELFFKLTKGRGRSWCVAYNAIICSPRVMILYRNVNRTW
jgi:hypothetical protein